MNHWQIIERVVAFLFVMVNLASTYYIRKKFLDDPALTSSQFFMNPEMIYSVMFFAAFDVVLVIGFFVMAFTRDIEVSLHILLISFCIWGISSYLCARIIRKANESKPAGGE
jgi:ABC-type multidrug transport system fused ATPase/permease subunit